MKGMRAQVGIILIFVLLAMTATAEQRPKGLLWHRSGLAATLPLQVKTDPAADYLLHLRDAETGKTVLAAYIRGGEFFRVLVPPGLYELLFAYGTDWQGEEDLFGRDTRYILLKPPLSFGATLSRREGHMIDLRDLDQVAIEDFAICQHLSLDLDSLRRRRPPDGPPQSRAEDLPVPFTRYDLLSRICD